MPQSPHRYPGRSVFSMLAASLLCSGLYIGSLVQDSRADPPPNNECSTGWCGTPRQSGGGGGGGGGGSILVNNTDDGKTYQHTDDYDGDGVPDQIDNCPFVKNRDQLDSDGDKRGDACDNCPYVPNFDQSDVNGNGKGDVCDPDADSDGIPNEQDNCWLVPNPGQEHNSDPHNLSKLGDVCNPDMDGDGVPNEKDNCPLVYNPDQSSAGFFGKACDYDADKDGIPNAQDNCPGNYNPDQKRTFPVKLDKSGNVIDRRGDACNDDIDSDGVKNNIDNCPLYPNADQKDTDFSGIGDACKTRWCFVVERQDKDACLDPANTFQIYSPTLPFLDPYGKVSTDSGDQPLTGQPVRLRLFANRTNVAFRFTWTVVSAPEGSHAVVDNPQGAVAFSTPWEYHYQADRLSTFTPDMPGRYVLKVTGSQLFSDPVNANWPREAAYQVTINATGDAMAAGCTASTPGRANSGGPLSGVAGLFGLFLFAGLAMRLRHLHRRRTSR